MKSILLKLIEADVLRDEKWFRALRRFRLFRHIPFVEFALAAGSMAMDTAVKNSDIDVIVGAKCGRIFTARLFSVAFFGVFGWRRRKPHDALRAHGPENQDKICLNHFVTEKRYPLSSPYNEYWKRLYQTLVPIWGASATFQKIAAAKREWIGAEMDIEKALRDGDRRYLDIARPSLFKFLGEKILSGLLGDFFEHTAKRAQIRRIEKSIAQTSGYKPRMVYTDDELEFHPDTRRTENYFSKNLS